MYFYVKYCYVLRAKRLYFIILYFIFCKINYLLMKMVIKK